MSRDKAAFLEALTVEIEDEEQHGTSPKFSAKVGDFVVRDPHAVQHHHAPLPLHHLSHCPHHLHQTPPCNEHNLRTTPAATNSQSICLCPWCRPPVTPLAMPVPCSLEHSVAILLRCVSLPCPALPRPPHCSVALDRVESRPLASIQDSAFSNALHSPPYCLPRLPS